MKIKVTPESLTLPLGKDAKFKAEVTGDPTNAGVVWTTDNGVIGVTTGILSAPAVGQPEGKATV